MNKLILFYGTPDKIVVPTYGKGEEKHDYGQGFYLTDSIDLAKEFVRDNIDIEILTELLSLGELVDSDANKVTNVFSTLF